MGDHLLRLQPLRCGYQEFGIGSVACALPTGQWDAAQSSWEVVDNFEHGGDGAVCGDEDSDHGGKQQHSAASKHSYVAFARHQSEECVSPCRTVVRMTVDMAPEGLLLHIC